MRFASSQKPSHGTKNLVSAKRRVDRRAAGFRTAKETARWELTQDHGATTRYLIFPQKQFCSP